MNDADEPKQLYARASPERRSRTTQRRRAASHLPTTFEEEEEELEQHPCQENKRPLLGRPTAKNTLTREAKQTTQSDSDDEDDEPPRKTNSDPKSGAKKHRKKPPTVVSSDSDLDDDQLGITPRTPPESPFYRRHRNTTTPAKTSKTSTPSTSTAKNTDQKTKTNQASRNPKQAETAVEPPTKKKKNRKARGGLEDLVQEQDKLYAELNKKARNSK